MDGFCRAIYRERLHDGARFRKKEEEADWDFQGMKMGGEEALVVCIGDWMELGRSFV